MLESLASEAWTKVVVALGKNCEKGEMPGLGNYAMCIPITKL